MPHTYPSGFTVGDRIKIISQPKKYNPSVGFRVGCRGTVMCPLSGPIPPDAVDIYLDGMGWGTVDAGCIQKLRTRKKKE